MAMHAVPETQTRDNLVVISAGRDHWLAGARQIVLDEQLGSDEDSVIQAMTTLLTEHPDATVVQLISHSDSRNLLKIGNWVVNTSAFANISAQLKGLLHGKSVHLIGCSTAVGGDASATLLALERRLGVDVLGTRGLVGHLDLDGNGLKTGLRDRLLRRGGQQLMPAADSLAENELLQHGAAAPFSEDSFRKLVQGLSAASTARVRDVLGLVTPTVSYAFPGILSLPSASEDLAGDGWIAGRLEVLFDGQLVRITRFRPAPASEPAGAVTECLFRVPRGQRPALSALVPPG